MEDYSTANPSQQLNDLLGGSTNEPLIPESLVVFLIACFVVLNLLTIAFFVFWIVGMVRRRKVQTAVLAMQKDIADIKQFLAADTHRQPPHDATSPQMVEQPSKDAVQQTPSKRN